MLKLKVRLHRSVALTVTRTDVRTDRLVYFIVARRPQRYPRDRSPIVYIGTTQKGLGRIAASAAEHADEVLALYGVDRFDVRVITCGTRRRVQTWRKLETALLLLFQQHYGALPLCNERGKRIRETDEVFRYFRRERLLKVLSGLVDSRPKRRRRKRTGTPG
jgi:hypothetical protein